MGQVEMMNKFLNKTLFLIIMPYEATIDVDILASSHMPEGEMLRNRLNHAYEKLLEMEKVEYLGNAITNDGQKKRFETFGLHETDISLTIGALWSLMGVIDVSVRLFSHQTPVDNLKKELEEMIYEASDNVPDDYVPEAYVPSYVH